MKVLATQSGTVTFDAVAGKTYSIVVDGVAGTAGDFTLAAACE
jgi:hypothetical protein